MARARLLSDIVVAWFDVNLVRSLSSLFVVLLLFVGLRMGLLAYAGTAALALAGLLALAVALNVAWQLVRPHLARSPHVVVTDPHTRLGRTQLAPRDPRRPPLVFHYVPVIGCAVSYGMDPLGFLDECRRKVRAAARSGAALRSPFSSERQWAACMSSSLLTCFG